MPHVKSYAGVAQQQSASSSSSPLPLVHWLLLTSANLSKSAWGALEKVFAILIIFYLFFLFI
jgi:hypothetical protein